MNHHRKLTLIAVLSGLSLLLLSACSLFGGRATPTPFPENPDGEEDPFIGIPNPASFYCEEMGYELELRENEDGGMEGVCIFPDGSECEEWEFLSGSCSIQWTFCQRQGFNIQAGDGMGVCTYPDGSSCPEYEFFIGECQPPEN
jgi:putative hemolysin